MRRHASVLVDVNVDHSGEKKKEHDDNKMKVSSRRIFSKTNLEGPDTSEGVIQTTKLPSDIPRVILISQREYEVSREQSKQ